MKYQINMRSFIYESDRPFLEIVHHNDATMLRVRQATEQGYAEVPVGGCFDIAYPTSTLRRSRTIGGYARQCPHLWSEPKRIC